jgi:hypothetical protein
MFVGRKQKKASYFPIWLFLEGGYWSRKRRTSIYENLIIYWTYLQLTFSLSGTEGPQFILVYNLLELICNLPFLFQEQKDGRSRRNRPAFLPPAKSCVASSKNCERCWKRTLLHCYFLLNAFSLYCYFDWSSFSCTEVFLLTPFFFFGAVIAKRVLTNLLNLFFGIYSYFWWDCFLLYYFFAVLFFAVFLFLTRLFCTVISDRTRSCCIDIFY